MANPLIQFFHTRTKVALASSFIIVFFIGFFIGREHLKYQIRSGMSEALSNFQSGMGGIFGGGTTKETNKKPLKNTRNEPLDVTLTEKKFVNSNYREGTYSDRVSFSLDITNKLEKDVRAFTGIIVFLDLFDKEIHGFRLTYEDGLVAGETKAWNDISFDYNQFIDSHARIANIDIEDLKVRLDVQEILFTDGTKAQY